MSSRAATWLAWPACILTAVLLAFGTLFLALNGGSVQDWVYMLGTVPTALVGGLIASRIPRNPIGWFFVVGALSRRCSGPRASTPSTGWSPTQGRCSWRVRWPGVSP